MTKNRRRKAEIRAHQAATGTAFLQARRETERPTLAAVMDQHPLLGDHGLGALFDGRKPREQHLAELADRRKILAGREAHVALTLA
jgi:hypothetical protein